MHRIRLIAAAAVLIFSSAGAAAEPPIKLSWRALSPIPDPLGVAGPFVGTQRIVKSAGRFSEILFVAGGANFPRPVWETQKQWKRDVFVATQQGNTIRWRSAGRLPQAVAYGVSVSTAKGMICIGGNRGDQLLGDCFRVSIQPDADTLVITPLPDLPLPVAYAAAARIDQRVYVFGGQCGASLADTSDQMWMLDLSGGNPDVSPRGGGLRWQRLPSCPGPSRAFLLMAAATRDNDRRLYVISGRRQGPSGVEFLTDTWEYTPRTQTWRRRADVPQCVMAGTAHAFDDRGLVVLAGADGTRFGREDELRDRHPGFPKQAWWYQPESDQWRSAGPTPTGAVTTPATRFGNSVIIASGEVRPRVRTPAVYQVQLAAKDDSLGNRE